MVILRFLFSSFFWNGSYALHRLRISFFSFQSCAGFFFLFFSVVLFLPRPCFADVGAGIRLWETSLAADFLVANHAHSFYDFDVAARSYRRVYDRDPEALESLNRAIVLEVLEGRIDSAAELARHMIRTDKQHYLSRLVLAVSAIHSRRYRAFRRHLSHVGEETPFVRMGKRILLAWSYQREGEIDQALSVLDVDGEADWTQVYYAYHSALIATLEGRTKEARRFFEETGLFETGIIRVLEAYGHFLFLYGEEEEKAAFLVSVSKIPALKFLLVQLRADGKSAGKQKFVVQDTRSGIAEAFYILSVMSEGGNTDISAVYLNLCLALTPDSPFALLALARIYNDWGQLEKSALLYERIPEESVFKRDAEFLLAESYERLGDVQRTIEILNRFLLQNPKDTRAAMYLAGVYIRRKDWESAIRIYDSVVEILSNPQDPQNWRVFYLRGVAHSSAGDWKSAEADLKFAVIGASDHAEVLNYLAYSWVEKGIELEKAREMLRKAVKLEPKNGNIIDSLGWCYYKLGLYDAAVRELERAVELLPGDVSINDHLGDAYWRAGQELEARYQWHHAFKLKRLQEAKAK